MKVLDLKLVRDVGRLWSQALAIALVLACGVAILLTTLGTYRALEETRQAYYERNRFADVFAAVRRAPKSLMSDIRLIEGVRQAESRISGLAVLDVPGQSETVTARLLSLPERGHLQLNVPLLRKGRLPFPDAVDEVAVSASFAVANDLEIGSLFHANLNGRKRSLEVVGTVLSPEFIYTIGPGAMMPDDETFGVLWMPENALDAAFDMQGAFNDLSLSLGPEAIEEAVIDELELLLAPYGSVGAYGRATQVSNSFIESELEQQKTAAMILPPIFYAISAFLVSMLIGRIVALARNEIGLLKALGYSNTEVSLHYLSLAGLIALGGVILGWIAGTWLARSLAGIYADFFDFPYLIFQVDYRIYALSGVLALVSAAVGALRSAGIAARMPPAVAMSPPAPPRFRRTAFTRLLERLRLSQPAMMVLRGLARWPVRSGMTTLGMAMAVAVIVASGFFTAALDELIDMTFYRANRQDAMLMFDPDIPESALEAVSAMPGVLAVEGQKFQPVILRNGHLEKRVAIEARRPGADLSRILASDGTIVAPPRHGILLTERLASQLQLAPGDSVEVEFRGERRDRHMVHVAGTVTQYVGLGAYMDLERLSALLGQAPRISVAQLEVDESKLDELHAYLKQTPRLSGFAEMNKVQRSFEDTIEENLVIMNVVYLAVAVLMTFGTTYNAARIQLSERARELASMRILGFSRAEVSSILVGETLTLALLAQPLGWLVGAGISYALAAGSVSDLYEIPLVLKVSGFAWASLVVLGAALCSALIVRRRLDRLDLVQVMKSKE